MQCAVFAADREVLEKREGILNRIMHASSGHDGLILALHPWQEEVTLFQPHRSLGLLTVERKQRPFTAATPTSTIIRGLGLHPATYVDNIFLGGGPARAAMDQIDDKRYSSVLLLNDQPLA